MCAISAKKSGSGGGPGVDLEMPQGLHAGVVGKSHFMQLHVIMQARHN